MKKPTLLISLLLSLFILTVTIYSLDAPSKISLSIQITNEIDWSFSTRTFETDYNDDGISDIISTFTKIDDRTIEIYVNDTRETGAYKWASAICNISNVDEIEKFEYNPSTEVWSSTGNLNYDTLWGLPDDWCNNHEGFSLFGAGSGDKRYRIKLPEGEEEFTIFAGKGSEETIIEYQSISLVNYQYLTFEINSTLERCDDNRANCGIAYPDVLIIDAENVKFGAEDNGVNNDTEYRYTFYSTKEIKQDSLGYYIEGQTIYQGIPITKLSERVRINTEDICYSKANFTADCSYNLTNVIINENITHYNLEVYFTGEFNSTGNNTMFIDPSYTISEFQTSESIDTNVRQENNFTHLEISDVAPYDSLVLYMPFDVENISTSVYDWSKEDNDGTIGGNPVWNSSGKYGGAYEFDGVGDYVDVNKNSYDLGIRDNATYCGWVRPNSNGTAVLISDYEASKGMNLRVQDPHSIEFYVYPNNHRVTTGNIVNIGSWNLLCGVINSSDALVYHNGIFIDSSTLGEDIGDSSSTLKIGERGDLGSAEWFNGSIDEVMIFNTSLTAQQILDIYNNQSSRFKTPGTQELKQFNATFEQGWFKWTEDSEQYFGSDLQKRVGEWEVSDGYNDTLSIVDGEANFGLVGYYHFDNLSAYGENDTHVYDYSGNGNNGTFNGTMGGLGIYSGAGEFDGVDDVVNVNYDLLDSSGNFTYLAWIKTDIDGIGHGIIEGGSNSQLTIDSGNKLQYRTFGGNTDSTSSILVANGWTHVAVGYNSTDVVMYINGNEDKFQTKSANELGGNYTIGKASSSYLNGSMDEVMVFNRSLSATEIKELYIKGRAKFSYTDYQDTDAEYIAVSPTATNFVPFYNFIAGNTTNPFYSPILMTSTASPINLTNDTGSDLEVAGCRALATAGATYTQVADIVQYANADCIIVQAENITFIGNGYSITSVENVSGVYSNQFNTTVKNCNISMGSGSGGIGIEFDDKADNSEINGNIINGSYYGIALFDSPSNCLLNNNSVYNTINQGVIIYANHNNNRIYNLYVSTGNGNAVWEYLGNNESFENITLIDSQIHLQNLFNSSLKNVTVRNNKIYLNNVDNNILDGLVVNDTTYGIHFIGGSQNNIIRNYYGYDNSYNVLFQACSGNYIYDSNLSDYSTAGVWSLTGSINNTIINSTYESETTASGNELIRKWYYQANVNDSDGNDVSDGTVYSDAMIDDTTGLVGYWKMNNDWEDSSGEGNDGTAVGEANFTDGKIGYAGSFDGDEDYVNISNTQDFNSTQISANVWFKSDIASTFQTIFSTTDSTGATGNGWMIILENDDDIAVWVYNSSNNQLIVRATTEYAVGEWTNVAFTHNGTNLSIYVNGVFEDSIISNGISFEPIKDPKIGVLPYATSTFEFNGTIDEVAIFNRSLSATEIKELYYKSEHAITQPTNSTGWINQTEVLDYVNLGGTRYGDGNQTLYASNVTYNESHTYNATFELNNLLDNFEFEIASPGDVAPVSILSYPADNQNYTNGTIVTFEINATDDSNLVNITLYVWNEDTSLNHTNTTTLDGTTNSTTFTYNFTVDGLYLWNGYVCDNATTTQCDWDVNRTLNISDVGVGISAYDRTISQLISTSAIINRLGNFKRTVLESIVISNIINRISSFSRTVIEIISFDVLAERTLNIFITIDQLINIDSVVDRFASYQRTITQFINFVFGIDAESSAVGTNFATVYLDISFGHSVDRLGSFSRNLDETLSINLALNRALGTFRTVSENINFNMIVGRFASYTRQLSDLININFSLDRSASYTRNLDETLTINSITSRSVGAFRTVYENINFNMVINRIGNFFRTVFLIIGIIPDEVNQGDVVVVVPGTGGGGGGSSGSDLHMINISSDSDWDFGENNIVTVRTYNVHKNLIDVDKINLTLIDEDINFSQSQTLRTQRGVFETFFSLPLQDIETTTIKVDVYDQGKKITAYKKVNIDRDLFTFEDYKEKAKDFGSYLDRNAFSIGITLLILGLLSGFFILVFIFFRVGRLEEEHHRKKHL